MIGLISRFAILTLAALPLGASLLSSTLSTQTPPFDPATGDAWSVGGSGFTELAVGFQDPSLTVSYLLSQIQVADGFAISDPNSSTSPALNNLNVGIWESATDDPNTATELQSWTIAAGSPGNPQLYTLTSVVSTMINPTDYYFIIESTTLDGANTAEWGWQENNLTPMQIGYFSGTFGTPGSFSYGDNPCTISPCTASNDPDASGTPAYSVSGTASTVPEPGTASVLGAGLLGILALRRLKSLAR